MSDKSNPFDVPGPHPVTKTFTRREIVRIRYLLLIFVAVAVGIVGWLYYQYLKKEKFEDIRDDLATVADLKVAQISNWLKERHGDAEMERRSWGVRNLAANPASKDAQESARRSMEVYRKTYNYAAILVADANGNVVMVDPPGFALQSEIVSEHVQEALHSTGGVVFSDMIRKHPDEKVYLWISGPVYAHGQTSGKPDGACVMIMDPKDFLFPALQKWPAPSETAETLLVAKQGDQIAYLNECKKGGNASLDLRLPLNGPNDQPAQAAIEGHEGPVEGIDYHGAPVWAEVRKVPGTDWHLVAKMDKDEVLAPVRSKAWMVGIIVSLLFIAGWLVVAFSWRRKTFQVLQADADRFRMLIERSPVAIGISRGDKTLYVNQKYLEIYRAGSMEEVIGSSLLDYWAPEYRDLLKDRIARRLRGEKVPIDYEGVGLRRDGTTFPIQVSVANVQLPDGPAALAFLTDISERVKSEQRIRYLNRTYAVLSEINQMIVRKKDARTIFETACRIAVEKGQFIMAWIGMINETTQVLEVAAFHGVENGYLSAFKIDLKDTALSSAPAWCCCRTGKHAICNDIEHDPVFEPWRKQAMERGYRSLGTFPLKIDDSVVGIFSLYAGVADLFDEEEIELLNELATDIGFALEMGQREAEGTHLATALEQSGESILITDTEGTIFYVNPAFERISGYSREEAVGLNARILKSGKHDAAFYRQMWETLKRGEVWHGHIVNKRKDGTLYEENATISPVRDTEGTIVSYMAVKLDITREVELELQFRQAQKLEAIGQLAGGVAHDFNNILAAIMMQAGLLWNKDLPEEIQEGLQQILVCAERAANLTRQLLLFSRKQTLQKRNLNLNEVVTNIMKMLQRIVGENYQFQIKLCPRKLPIYADAGMLDQILLNLVVNSRDAMPSGGELIIETSEKTFTEEEAAAIPETAPGYYACLSVKDNGSGISPESLSRIFEPFYTTKGPGQGTGLGLATVFGIVKQHGGTILVDSKVDEGATFRIYLPAEKASSQLDTQRIAGAKPVGGTETILLVEDEAIVRRLTKTTLEHAGYRVIESSDAAQARQLWQRNREDIDLLLTDIIMPGVLDGRDLAKILRDDRPSLRVIFISGYIAEIAGQELVMEEGQGFIQKPISPSQLLEKVRQLLDA